MNSWTTTTLLVASSALLTSTVFCAPSGLASSRLRPSSVRVQDDEAFFVRAGEAGANVMNFQDENASVVRRAEAGTLMRVRKTDVGFQNVEVAGGLQVWVHGKFLEATAATDVLRCAAWGVLMRPGPDSTVEYMPITVKLQRGDLVRKIELSDPTLPMDKTWVKVWSPPHARGWVKQSETVKVSDEAAAKSEWEQLSAAALLGSTSGSVSDAAAPTPKSGAGQAPVANVAGAQDPGSVATRSETADALARADQLYEAAQASESGFGPVVAAYEGVLAGAAAGSTTYGVVEQRLKEARLHHEIEQLEADARAQRLAEEKKLEQLRRERESQDLKETAHWGRFTERGWVHAQKIAGEKRYFLEWSGETIAEIRCSTGRYDLSVLEDFEIGLKGVLLRAAMPARTATFNSEAIGAEPKLLDVTRVEVISARR